MADYRTPDDISMLDEVQDVDKLPDVPPQLEVGATGLKRSAGYIDEEFLPALRGRKAIAVFREMSQNDSIVGSMLFAVTQLLKNIQWNVVPADNTEENQKAAEFVEQCMNDMSHSWGDFITEVMTMLPYGWSWHEIVYKKRVGPWEKDPKKRSQYTDGKIGWRKMPIRSQETLLRWVFDESGGVQGMVQMAPPSYKTVVLPINKCLLFRTNQSKGNPEGMSVLRTAYRSWYFKKRLEEFEGIGVERDLAGMPVARIPAEYLKKDASPDKKAMADAFRKMVRGVRRDENEGLLLPSQFDQDHGNQLFEFELMSSTGARQFDTNQIIGRYEQRILMSMLADFILVGHEGGGSYALHTDKTGIFRSAINSIADSVADVLNRHAIPRLFELNAWKLDELPKFVPANVDPPDLTQLSSLISSTSAAGMQWFPDPELEKFVRDVAQLPEMSDDVMEQKREMFEATQMMEQAETQMGMLGLKQKAEMTAQGYSPEQAQMAAETPTGDIAAQEQSAQLDAQLVAREHPEYQMEQEEMAAEQEQQVQAERENKAVDLEDKDKDRQHQEKLARFKARGDQVKQMKGQAKSQKPPVKKRPPKGNK